MRPWLFGFFLVSGFSSLVCEVVWIRLAMAAFGVTTPFVSIVLSVFMGGLAIGSVAAGRLVRRMQDRGPSADLRAYGLAEVIIGASALLVPGALEFGRVLLERAQGDAYWSGALYLTASGAWITLVLLPACVCMGATFPLAMSALQKSASGERSFSFLYVANVVGATSGALVSAFVLVELLGFRGTSLVAALLNAALCVGAFRLSTRAVAGGATRAALTAERSSAPGPRPPQSLLIALFTTGLLSMAMEVVWVRQFTPYMGTMVYAFALILATYLGATAVGSSLYQRASTRGAAGPGTLAWIAAGTLALLPLASGDPRAPFAWGLPYSSVRLLAGIAPIAGAFGYLTPMLVDRWSRGDPERAGRAYAVNVIGCILGPLLACFVLLPTLGERWTNIVLAAPLFLAGITAIVRGDHDGQRTSARRAWVWLAAWSAAATVILATTRAFETRFPSFVIRRDATATAIVAGEGRARELFTNGISMTGQTPITKMMVHLPMAWRPTAPRDVLVICFGMGTSFRSALSWGASCTSVELVPSVPELFRCFHDDADELVRRPGARIVVDDGRRFLERTAQVFDVIVIDPPPPIEAAGSSLLYSCEFYRIAKRRLQPGGIVQQWLPGADVVATAAVIRALQAEFRHVRGFVSCENWGLHFLASDEPLADVSAAVLASRLPPNAATDLVEWGPESSPERQFQSVLSREGNLDVTAIAPDTPALSDDRPVNEYFLLRSMSRSGRGGGARTRAGR